MGFARRLIPLASFLDTRIGWDRLPRLLGIMTLIGLREQLRRRNLLDTGWEKTPSQKPASLDARTLDGGWNDLRKPSMGSLKTQFGRNVPFDRAHPEGHPGLLEPSPRVVSRRLLARERFIPAESVNLLAAAWIQFEVHDWLSHDTDDAKPISLELDDDDRWPERTMK
ncbi:MAG: peroxidase family protein, partial [Gaiellaceae bacterium]